MDEIIQDGKFPQGTNFGTSNDVFKKRIGGDAADWTTKTLGIPCAEMELGKMKDQDRNSWKPKNTHIAMYIVE